MGIKRNVKTKTVTPVSDDEEDLTLLQLSEARRKAAAALIGNDRSTTTSVPATASEPLRASPNVQQSKSHALQEAFDNTEAHVNSQKGSDGLPVICSNESLQTYMIGLEDALRKNNGRLFRSMQATINRELVRVGISASPDALSERRNAD